MFNDDFTPGQTKPPEDDVCNLGTVPSTFDRCPTAEICPSSSTTGQRGREMKRAVDNSEMKRSKRKASLKPTLERCSLGIETDNSKKLSFGLDISFQIAQGVARCRSKRLQNCDLDSMGFGRKRRRTRHESTATIGGPANP